MTIHSTLLNSMPEMVAIRRDLHEHPELGLEEVRTSEVVARHLESYGYTVTRGLAKTGVVATLSNGTGRRSIGIRADFDALPIFEETGLAYASKTPGKMHACGHDGHTAMLLGAAKYLAETRNFSGAIAVIFRVEPSLSLTVAPTSAPTWAAVTICRGPNALIAKPYTCPVESQGWTIAASGAVFWGAAL